MDNSPTREKRWGTFVVRHKTEVPKRLRPKQYIYLSTLYIGKYFGAQTEESESY